MIQWDQEKQCLTDYMGVPVSRSLAIQYRDHIKAHLKNSAADLAAIALKDIKQRSPDMVEQVDFDPENYE